MIDTGGQLFARAHEIVLQFDQWVRLGLDASGGVLIAIGALVVISRLLRRTLRSEVASITAERLVLARFLTLALEFQLAADVLDTAIAPGWQEIEQLAAIAVIRTLLNMSLTREIAEERKSIAERDAARKSNASGAAVE
jgi:uncharacterized membrane protein